MRGQLLLVALVVAVCEVESQLDAATLIVDLAGGADYSDIQSALDAAADGDTVIVKPGEYVIAEPLDFNRGPEGPSSAPLKDVMLESEGGAEVTTNFLFLGGHRPPGPFPDFGIDPWIDSLDCKADAGCP